ncbi:unnamed protein product [Staurois parvus]|uniref:Uncharacterized protein n=1 Tax=Staurois parvus TaxID=386267 RepID=A0ABN9AZ78_9NEOB|nr:unnamed protein product [Staurois parvus]
MPTVTVDGKEKEIAEKNNQQVYQKVPSSVRQQPEITQRTELKGPVAATYDCPVNNNIQSPEPKDSVFCPVQTVDNNTCASDSFYVPPGTPNFLPYSEKSPTHAGDTVTVDENTHNPVHTSQGLTLGMSVASTSIQKCAPEPVNGCPSKKIKLAGSVVSETLYSESLNANHVTKPVMNSVAKELETTCLSNRSDALLDQSPHSSPSKLHRKVKGLVRKARKQEDLPATPVRKVSVPVEEYELSSPRDRLLSLFETSEAQSEFCGFSCKSDSLPRGMDVKKEHPASKDNFNWCLFSTTSSSAETFYGF